MPVVEQRTAPADEPAAAGADSEAPTGGDGEADSKSGSFKAEGLGSERVSRSRLKSEVNDSAELTNVKGGVREMGAVDHQVGTFTCRGMEDGKLKANQDAACFAQPFSQLPGTAFFCVADGHGKNGDQVSQEVLNSLVYELEEQADELITNPGLTMAESFEAVNHHLEQMCSEAEVEVNAIESGACAIAVWLRGHTLWTSSVGDCRAVLGVRHNGNLLPYMINQEHKVDDVGEQARIVSNGGWVRPAFPHPDDGQMMAAKMYMAEGRADLGPGLSVSRAFGDLSASKIGLVPSAELAHTELTDADEYLILATDGVWEFMSNEEVLAIVYKHFVSGNRAQEACKYIIARAALAWKKNEGSYRDDITVMVVYLPDLIRYLKAELAVVAK